MKKEFGTRGRFGSARKVLKAFKLISNKEDFPSSLGVSADRDLRRPKIFNAHDHKGI